MELFLYPASSKWFKRLCRSRCLVPYRSRSIFSMIPIDVSSDRSVRASWYLWRENFQIENAWTSFVPRVWHCITSTNKFFCQPESHSSLFRNKIPKRMDILLHFISLIFSRRWINKYHNSFLSITLWYVTFKRTQVLPNPINITKVVLIYYRRNITQ